MAVWQVDFHLVPRSALTASSPLGTAPALNEAPWLRATFPADYRVRLPSVAPASRSLAESLESWGEEQGNRIDVWSEHGRVSRVEARVDVRRLDSRFGAALLVFVRAADAALVRADGLVIAPGIASFVAALRSAPAWRYANDPAEFIATRAMIDDESE